MDAMRELFETLDRRDRPEDVAEKVSAVLVGLPHRDRQVLNQATRTRRGHYHPWYVTSMSRDFRRVEDMSHMLSVAGELFPVVESVPGSMDLEGIDQYLDVAERAIAKTVGKSDFKHDRLNKAQRVEAGLGMSRRRYNKLFRLAARMEDKRRRMGREMEKREFTQMSKSRLASRVTWEEFQKDQDTACFIAYYASRCNLRSQFTNTSQERPYDTISHMLFLRCRSHPETTNWKAMAYVYPDMEVLGHLTDVDKGDLLGQWFGALVRIARLLEETWNRSNINAQTMIVRRGNDSSTWNVTAGAWNKARDSWINLLHTLGMEAILDRMCVGKVLRLMAADVAYWHRATGGSLEPDTQVWAELPKPWEVLTGRASCTKEEVEVVCRRHGVDPHQKGWVAPKPKGKVQEFKPTPELVHGVTVADPFLAGLFRKWGVFSGKELKV